MTFTQILYKCYVMMCVINVRDTECCVIKRSDALQPYISAFYLMNFILWFEC
jgi:hypothetical protein